MDSKSTASIVDPICGMGVTVSKSAITFTFIDVTYLFCSNECREQFQRAPERHLVYLAHEPADEHYGYGCPTQYELRSHTSHYDE